MRHLRILLLIAAIFLGLGPVQALAQDPSPVETPELTEEVPQEEPAAEPAAEPSTGVELQEPAEVLSTVQLVIQAMKEGKWGLVVAGILMLLMWALRTFVWQSLPKDYLPYITVGVSGVVAFSTAVITGSAIMDAVWVSLGGVLAGLAGVGFWEFLGKKVLPKPPEE
jgi:small-conductance mechanosensitive channel